MKIIEPQNANLTNFEALQHISNVRTRYSEHPDFVDKPNALQKHLYRIIADVLQRLTASPSPLDGNTFHYAPERIATLLRRLEKFKLTKSELIDLCNLPPKDIDALEPLVEEVETRFTKDEQEEMVKIIGEVLSPDAMDLTNGDST